MAAATENGIGRTETVEGNHAVMYCNVTWDNGDTFDTGYDSILDAAFKPTTNSAPGLTQSGGTLTLVSGGALTGNLRIVSGGGS